MVTLLIESEINKTLKECKINDIYKQIKKNAPNNTLHPTRFPLHLHPSAKLRGWRFRAKRAAERGVMRWKEYLKNKYNIS